MGTSEITYVFSALVVMAAMTMLYPLAMRHADSHDGDTGIYGSVFRNVMWVLKIGNVLGWGLVIATMLTEISLPIDARVVAIATALVSFGLMDMDNYLAKRRAA
jgi:hypothetical protein